MTSVTVSPSSPFPETGQQLTKWRGPRTANDPTHRPAMDRAGTILIVVLILV